LWTICCQSFDFNKCFFFADQIWLWLSLHVLHSLTPVMAESAPWAI
jgi:hypothetical protein